MAFLDRFGTIIIERPGELTPRLSLFIGDVGFAAAACRTTDPFSPA
jgi:hypothetical protein